MNRIFRSGIINLLLLVTIAGCNRNRYDIDISGVPLEMTLHRFDESLFSLNFDTIDNAVKVFYEKYDDFFDVYNVHVINIGPASDRYYGSYLSMFVNNPQNIEVYEYTANVFNDMSDLEEIFTNAFKRYKYHFPDSVIPEIVCYVGGFNHKIFTVEEYIGVGLDQYLGRDCPYYKMIGTPSYITYNKHPDKIPSDVAKVWASSLFPFNDSIDNVLSRMIYQGKLLYFSDVLLPKMGDSLKIGFSPSEMKFVRNNENQMWTYLIEHELLFSTDQLEIKKLTDEAPSTYYFPSESPGRSAVWIGWQIVREFAGRNKDLSVAEVMKENDYHKILRESRYSP